MAKDENAIEKTSGSGVYPIGNGRLGATVYGGIEWRYSKLVRASIRKVSSATGECMVRDGETARKILVPRGE